MKNRGFIAAAALGILLAAPASDLGASSPGGENPRTLEGQVTAVRQSTLAANEGSFTEIRIQTRQREETWLRLGPTSEFGNRFQAGDRIRARVMAGGDGTSLVRDIRNRRTGESLKVRSGDGTLLRQHDRGRLRDGTGTGDPDRDRDRSRQKDRQHSSGHQGKGGGGGPRGGGR